MAEVGRHFPCGDGYEAGDDAGGEEGVVDNVV